MAENAAEVRELVSPGVYYKVVHNMTMKIVPTQRVDWPPRTKTQPKSIPDRSGCPLTIAV
jgi:hypothetical protein